MCILSSSVFIPKILGKVVSELLDVRGDCVELQEAGLIQGFSCMPETKKNKQSCQELRKTNEVRPPYVMKDS